MTTELQRKFYRSRLFRELMAGAMLANGLPIQRGQKRIFNKIYADVFGQLPEPQIKQYLFEYLECYDATEEGKAEALRLLQCSSTALTKEQRQRIAFHLSE